MKTQRYGNTVKVWISSRETYDWAHKPGAAWPCSTISGHRIFAEFYNGDLVDFCGPDNVNPSEFNAIIEDFLGSSRPGE